MPEPPDPEPSLSPPERGSEALAAARLAAIIDSADDGIISKTLEGTVTSWNSAAERIFGYSAEEMIGASIYRLIPQELQSEEHMILDRISRGERVERYETTRLRKDGTRISIELTISPVRNADGVIVGATSIKRDVTGRRDTADALARLAAIVQSSDDPILSKTLAGTITSWNPAAERVFGYTAAEVIGRSINCIVPDTLQGEEADILGRVGRGEHVAHYETLRRRKDGTDLNISLTISPLRGRDGMVLGASSIMRDITDRLRIEASLRQTAKLEAIGRLAGGLAHDFNNQLYALSGFAHFVARDPGLSAASHHDLLQVQQAIERMAGMTRQLLAFARQQVLNPETLDLNEVVTDTQPLLQRLIGSSIKIELGLAAGPKWVRVDRSQLVQVLMNLVINARDAIEESGTVTIRSETLEVSPGQRVDRVGGPIEAGAYAELEVSDSGAGIAPEHLPRIFEPFFTTKEAGLGTGLGLATVDGIVSQSGGHIQVESVPDRGTTVRVLFPLAGEPALAPPTSERPKGRASSARILVVDDEPQVRAILARTLRAEGHDVIEAVDGSSAISCFEEMGGAIDLLLTDVVMPGIGGRDLARELTRRSPGLRVVWVSGHPRDVGLRNLPLDHPFLQKPVPPDLLVDTVREALERQARPTQ
jgi:two-component system cell cycle sensor histidine kinase/response regulator CckA